MQTVRTAAVPVESCDSGVRAKLATSAAYADEYPWRYPDRFDALQAATRRCRLRPAPFGAGKIASSAASTARYRIHESADTIK